MPRTPLLLCLLLLVGCGEARKLDEPQKVALAHIEEKLQGRVEGETSIVKIDFTGTNITDTDLEVVTVFPELERLDLAGTEVTDAGMVHLQGLTKLQYLRVSMTRVTSEGLRELRAARPQLVVEP